MYKEKKLVKFECVGFRLFGMKRNEIYQIWLDGNGAREGKTSDYRKSFKKKKERETGKKNKTTQKCDTRQNSKFSVRRKNRKYIRK